MLRGLVLGGKKLDPNNAVRAREDHFAFTITRHETEPLAERIWELRHQFTSRAASYLPLPRRSRRPCSRVMRSWPPRATTPTSTCPTNALIIRIKCGGHPRRYPGAGRARLQ